MFTKAYTVAFFLSMVSEVTIRKNSQQTLPYAEEATAQKVVIGFWTVALIIKLKKYWTSADLKTQTGMVSFKKICRSAQGMFFTHHW